MHYSLLRPRRAPRVDVGGLSLFPSALCDFSLANALGILGETGGAGDNAVVLVAAGTAPGVG